MKLYKNLNQILTLRKAHKKDGRFLTPDDLDVIQNASIVFDQEKIHWIGNLEHLPEQFSSIPSFDLSGHILTPELVDSHTHIVFGGDRAHEYAQRLNGVSYEQIAKDGGGILFTMKETKESTHEKLLDSAIKRIERIHSYGIGTIEIKSGYGLSYEKEKDLSLIIHELKKRFAKKVQIFNTYLAAHDIPKSFSSSKAYLDEVVLPLLSELAPLKLLMR